MAKHKPYQDSDWPKDKATFRVIEYSKPNNDGRQSLDVLWWDINGRPRCQAFFANKDELTERFVRLVKGEDPNA